MSYWQSMRPPVDESGIRSLARELARVVRTPVRLYLTGGSTAVIEGWRPSTVDVDLRFEPEADDLLRALPALKERLYPAIDATAFRGKVEAMLPS